jgi:hypothetical protein
MFNFPPHLCILQELLSSTWIHARLSGGFVLFMFLVFCDVFFCFVRLTEEAITNGQYTKRHYLHWAQKKLSRMDNTWRDNIYIEHRSYQEWTIHEKTLSTLSTEETIKNLFMYCPFLIASSVLNVNIVSSCIVHSW